MNVAVLIVAAGRGTRASRPGETGAVPKQYAVLGSRPVLARTITAFASHPAIRRIRVVVHPDDLPHYEAATRDAPPLLATPVPGGATRQESVRLGLQSLASDAPDIVLIHDAARPFVSPDVIDRVLAAIGTAPDRHAGAIAAVPVSDTLKRAGAADAIAGTVDRNGLWRAQTPQGFLYPRIQRAHLEALDQGRTDFTDDAAIAEWAGLDVALVVGAERNLKLTTPEDMAMADHMLREGAVPAVQREVRTGSGFDVHRFTSGDHVWLCGVKLPHTHGLDGHSDADVALHALTDALLGAIADGDIGSHFPPSDPRWKGAASRIFLQHAADLVARRGGAIGNVDITILAEAPRIGPHRDDLRRSVAEILRIDVGRVAVKATTTEQLGFTGRREGVAAMATATVMLPV